MIDPGKAEGSTDPAQTSDGGDIADAGARVADAFVAFQGIANEVSTLAIDVREGATRLGHTLRGEVDVHPYRTVAIAAGVGYVLGGGLASGLTRVLVRAALRAIVIPALKEPLAQALGAFASAANTKPASR